MNNNKNHLPISRFPCSIILLLAVLGTGGCDSIQKWITQKANERVAREDSSADDKSDEDDSPPKKKKEKPRDQGRPPSNVGLPPVPTLRIAPPAGTQTGVVDDFLKDPSLAVKAFKEKPVSPHAVELTLYPEYGELVAEDPSKAGSALEYEIRGEHVSAGKPPLIPPDDVKAAFFDLGTIDWKLVATLLATEGPKRLGDAQQKASYFIVKRDLPFGTDVVITVYFSGGEHAVEFDTKGKWIRNI